MDEMKYVSYALFGEYFATANVNVHACMYIH